jgi:hypothetical protein
VLKLNWTVAFRSINTLAQFEIAADFTKTMIIYVFREYTPMSVDVMNREGLDPGELGPDEGFYTAPTNISLDKFIFFAKHESFRVASKSCIVISPRADGLTLDHVDEISGRIKDVRVEKMNIEDLVAMYSILVGT